MATEAEQERSCFQKRVLEIYQSIKFGARPRRSKTRHKNAWRTADWRRAVMKNRFAQKWPTVGTAKTNVQCSLYGKISQHKNNVSLKLWNGRTTKRFFCLENFGTLPSNQLYVTVSGSYVISYQSLEFVYFDHQGNYVCFKRQIDCSRKLISTVNIRRKKHASTFQNPYRFQVFRKQKRESHIRSLRRSYSITMNFSRNFVFLFVQGITHKLSIHNL